MPEQEQDDLVGNLDALVKASYADREQPGLDPGNRPGGTVAGERDPHKTVRDLEDLTGNPGHRGVTASPILSMNPVVPGGDLPSINEPPGLQQEKPSAEENERDTETTPDEQPPQGYRPY